MKLEEVLFIRGKQIPYLPLSNENEYAYFKLKPWTTLGQVIRPVQYGISVYVMTTINTLMYAHELPELFMKSKEEVALWRMLRRISNNIEVHLDDINIDQASNITYLNLRNLDIHIDHSRNELEIQNSKEKRNLDIKLLEDQPSMVFKEIVGMIEY